MIAVVAAYGLYRFLTRGERAGGGGQSDITSMGSIDFH
jgi:hypothetical protein